MLSFLSWLSLASTLLLLAVLYWNVPKALWLYYKRCQHFRHYTSWPTHWLLGHLHVIRPDEKTLLKYQAFMTTRKPRISGWWVGPFFASAGIPHPKFLKTLLKEEKSRPIYKMLMPWLGEGLLIAEGKKWARNRRLLTPAFHFEILRGYIPVYNETLAPCLQKLHTAAREGTSVRLYDTISLLSLDIILQCAFSYKSDCQNVAHREPYVEAVCSLSHLITDRFLNPLLHLDWVYALTAAGRESKRYCQLVHKHSMAVIDERRKTLNLNQTDNLEVLKSKVSTSRRYLDFLDILLTAADDDGVGLSDLEIRAEADTFMFEGHDTTTSGICWTLYCLALHPEHQQKAREEVQRVLMGKERLEYEDLNELQYTKWCIKEAMRLYPPVPEVYRKVTQDVQLDQYTLPEDTQFSIMIWAIHHNPEVWEEPFVFDPLRFHPSKVEKRDPYAYIPFSAGHRNCIGQNFALNEQRVVVGRVLSQFRLSVDPDHIVEREPHIILRAKYDIKLKFEEL